MPTVVNSYYLSTTFGASPRSVTINPVASGNTLIVAFSVADVNQGAGVSATDNQGNTYTQDLTFVGTNLDNDYYIFRASNITNAPTSVSCVFGASNALITFYILEVSGLDNASPVDATVADTTSTASATPSKSITTNTANCLIFGILSQSNNRTFTADAGYSQLPAPTQSFDFLAYDNDVGAAGSKTVSGTLDVFTNWRWGVVAYKAATSQTVVISDNTTGSTYTGSDSTYISSNQPNTSLHGEVNVSIRVNNPTLRTLLRFTGLSNITGPVTVTSATLSMYISGSSGVTDTVNLYELTRPWVKTTATWNNYSTGNAWATPGAEGVGDRNPTAVFTGTAPSTSGQYYDISSAALAALVQDWINGAKTNEGLLLTNNSAFVTFNFTSDDGTDGQRPRLSVTYTTSNVSRPSSDITTTGWSASSGVVLYDMIDEATPSDADYIISPDVTATPGPAIFGITPTQSTGTMNVRIRARRTDTAGQVRVLLLDSGGTTVGTSSWQSLTTSFTTYTLSVTTSATAERVRIEVQP